MAASKASLEVPYRLEFENRPGYFYIYIKCGRLDLKTTKAIVREGAKELNKTAYKKVLVELDVDKRLSTADIFWLAAGFPDLGLEEYRFAVVDARLEHEASNDFADAAARSNEIRRRTFTSIEEAEQWLALN